MVYSKLEFTTPDDKKFYSIHETSAERYIGYILVLKDGNRLHLDEMCEMLPGYYLDGDIREEWDEAVNVHETDISKRS